MARRKKQFECGHSGYGQFCHRCRTKERERSEAAALRAERAAQEAQDPIPLAQVGPPVVTRKARLILNSIAAGKRYQAFRCKQIRQTRRDIVSVPVGWGYRLLFERTTGGLVPLELVSHETYNTRLARI